MSQSVLVTGASGGLGVAVVNKLHQEGFQVIATARKTTGLEAASEIAPVDLTNAEVVTSFVKELVGRHPELRTAVLLVGGFAMGNIHETDLSMIQEMIRLNFETTYHVVRALLPHFEKNGGGQFILIGSKAGLSGKDSTSTVAYGLSKTMVMYLAELINGQGRHKGIKASVVVPSIIDTPQNREGIPNADYSKWTTPEAIADSIHFLMTESGKHLRQTELHVYNES